MKKLVLAVTSFLFAVSVQATNLTEGKQYVTLNQAPVQQAEVIEFFSFIVHIVIRLNTNTKSQIK